MRQKLVELVKTAILFEYRLPSELVSKSNLSNVSDRCFSSLNSNQIAEVIYNGIVEFSKKEFDIDYERLDIEMVKAIQRGIRYNTNATEDTKVRYGFYGEVLLYAILKVYLGIDVLISKGYFFSILDGAEAKGFDVFHLVDKKNSLELWFGESKFYQNYKVAIKKILDSIEINLSDEYLNKNLSAIIDEKQNLSTASAKIKDLIESWEQDPLINLMDELKKYELKLVYPMFVAFEKKKNYTESIQKCIDYVSEEIEKKPKKIPLSCSVDLFFIFLPLEDTITIKRTVVKWIDSKKPLI